MVWQNAIFLFLYHTVWVLTLHTYLVGWGFFFFVPFLIQKIFLASPEISIRTAFFCGFLLDICSGSDYLGLFAVTYSFLMLLLHGLQPYLIEEKIYSLCILSCVSTVFLLFAFPLLGRVVGVPVARGAFSGLSWLEIVSINILYTLVSLGPFWWKKRDRCEAL